MSPELAGLQAIRESARPNHTRGVESARLELPVDQTETDSPPHHSSPISTVDPDSSISRLESYNTVFPIETVSLSRRAPRQISLRSTKNYSNLIDIRPVHTAANAARNSISIKRLTVGFINIRSLSTKALLINDLITDHKLDMMGLCETWLKPNDFTPLIEASPPNYTSAQVAREAKKGGGVALIFNTILNLNPNNTNTFTSFEVLTLRYTASSLPSFYLAVLYRPPGPYSLFLEEFSNFISDLVTRADNILIIGDFNIHINNSTDPLSKAFLDIIDTCGLTQFVCEPTHRGGNTLDLVLTRGIPVSALMVSSYVSALSDHYLIKFEIELICPRRNCNDTYSSRRITASTVSLLSEQLPSFLAPLSGHVGSLDNLTNELNSTLTNALDSIAPLVTKRHSTRKLAHWFTNDTRALKLACRKLERRWRLTKLEVFRLAWNDSLLNYKRALSSAKTAYYSKLINANKNNPKFLFRTVAKLTSNPSPSDTSLFSANDFMTFFTQKITLIREEITSILSTHGAHLESSTGVSRTDCLFSQFDLVSLDSLSRLVLASKPTTCMLDPLPAKLLKELLPILGPLILIIINQSLSTGIVPSAFKTAVIKPLLKKPNLDHDVLQNYRPISNLPFLSKVLERAVASQLTDFLSNNNLYDPFQSGFRSFHSTETALTRVVNDLLLAIDSNSTSVLLLLDLSAAFDTIDHSILLNRLENYIGIRGSALSWFRSYLLGRSHRVFYNNVTSECCTVDFGVPQGSVLGPLLFSIYMLPLGDIIRKYGINFHCYADDTQIYIPVKPTDHSQLQKLEACLSEIKRWMSLNFLLLNANKTEMLVIGPARHSHLFENTTVNFDGCVISQSPYVKNLGVKFDPTLSLELHIKETTRTAFYHLRNIARIRPILTKADAEILVHAFVSSRIDYCNVLFSGLPSGRTKMLQLVQNAAARILTNTKKFDHITPVLASLHWLPIQARCDFKVLLLTYKSLHGMAPSYLSDLITPYVPPRALRSQGAGYLSVPAVKKKTAGNRAFSYRAPYLWNSLPASIREAGSIEIFKSKLKTHLFSLSFSS